MPAEWEPHAATWLTWPRPEGISFPGHYETVPSVYAELIRRVTEAEEVNINVWHGEMEASVRQILAKAGTPLERVRFHHFPAYEPWCRDHGPVFLIREKNARRERAVVDWGYNAWGGKYPPCELDDAISSALIPSVLPMLLVAQRRHRIRVHRAAGGEVAGDEGHDSNDECDGRKGDWIVGADTKQ